MAIANANGATLAYVKESTWGVNPVTGGKLLNFTSCNIGGNNSATNSNFIRNDTNVNGTVRTAFDTSGNIAVELQYGSYDEFIEAALRGTFTTAVSVDLSTGVTLATGAFDSASNTITKTGIGTNLSAGQWVKITGCNITALNGYWQLKTVAAGVLTTKQVLPTGSVTAGTLKSSVCKNGTTQSSFTIQQGFTDIGTASYLLSTGQRVGSMGFSFSQGGISTGTISVMGKTITASTSAGLTSPTAALTNPSMNTVNDIKQIFINGTPTTAQLTAFDFSISTNAEALKAIGTLNAVSIKQGSIGVTANMTVYFEDITYLNYVYGFTSFDIAIVTEDSLGNGYIWHFPECMPVSGGNPDIGGINQPITQQFSFNAVLDPTLSLTASVSKYPL